jgi:hypothetical protein
MGEEEARLHTHLVVVQLLQQLLTKFIHNKLSIATKPLLAEGIEEAAKRTEDEKVAEDGGLNAWALHFDRNLLACVAQNGLVHLVMVMAMVVVGAGFAQAGLRCCSTVDKSILGQGSGKGDTRHSNQPASQQRGLHRVQ